ncbi:hypothetical protein PILCRDRAFT_2316 [Piloderma croceum F 1598]|uniref:Uncharacterized protein n=1 Tax=Piloderma croceum (strain F 1598) TaxID=765440 RepID=A0A0C3BR94_PILCF|nr:hypothetical protein PILCRDRAFT_2316 [Piloderma croceum F 1598]
MSERAASAKPEKLSLTCTVPSGLDSFIAFIGSHSTIEALITMVQLDNRRQQAHIDASGIARPRSLDFLLPAFTDPKYELVALYPEHFLLGKTFLMIYNQATASCTNYVAANDRHIRNAQSGGPSASRHSYPHEVYDNLVDLLYWRPVPAEGSPGAVKVTKAQAKRRHGPQRSARPRSAQILEGGSTKDDGNGEYIPTTFGATPFQAMELRCWRR